MPMFGDRCPFRAARRGDMRGSQAAIRRETMVAASEHETSINPSLGSGPRGILKSVALGVVLAARGSARRSVSSDGERGASGSKLALSFGVVMVV